MFVSRARKAVLIGLAAFSVVAAGCGSDDDSSTSSSSAGATTAAAKPAGKAIKVGLVTDIGGLDDKSFNYLSDQGLQRAKKELGVTGRTLTSSSNADYVPNLSTLAQQKYDLIIGVGFLMADAIDTVAKKFPDTNFAIIDVDQTTLKNKPANVQGLLFKEQEGGYLAGYLAGLYAKDNSAKAVSTVGGVKIPPVDRYIAGFQAGAEKADPGIKTLNGYSQDFVDQGKCKELALNQIGQGSKVVMQVAGKCGLGALDAAKEKNVLGVGVDADQNYLGDHVIASVLKKTDVAVFDEIKAVQSGTYKGGGNTNFDVKSGGIALGPLGTAGEKYGDQVKEIQSQLAAGSIQVPDTVAAK